MVTTTCIQSKTIITKLFLFLKCHVPNKLQIFVGHGNVKDHLSVKKTGFWVAAVLTNQLRLNSHLCHIVKTPLSPSIWSWLLRNLQQMWRAVGGCRQGIWWSKRLAASGSSTLLWCWSGCAVCARASLMSLCSSPVLYEQLGAEKKSPYVELAADDSVLWNSVVCLCLFDHADSFFWNHLHYIDSFTFLKHFKQFKEKCFVGFLFGLFLNFILLVGWRQY